MSGTSRDPTSGWHIDVKRKLRAYRALSLPVALLVLCALGWYLVIQQNALVTAAAVSAYQQTELEMTRVLARTIERYANEQLNADGPATVTEVEQFVVARYIEPVHLLTTGGAWLYSPERGLLDSGSGVPYGLAADRVSGALRYGASGPTTSSLAATLAAGHEGTTWLVGSSSTGAEIVAWSPVSVANDELVIGIAVPLDEILASTGTVGQVRALVLAMALASLTTVALLVAWLRAEQRRRASREAERLAQQQLEERVLERTAALRQANQALAESERRYHEFADSLPQVVFEADARGTLTFVNRAALEVLGLTTADLAAGQNAMALVAPADRMRVARSMRRVLTGRVSHGAEYTLRLGNGTVMPAIVHANAVMRDGVPIGIRGVVIDIRERKAAEEALRESERRFRDMLERVQLFAAILDVEGHIVFCNQCLLQTTGWRWEELAGQDWFSTFVPPDSREYLRERFTEYALPDAEPMRHRVQQLLTRDGGRRTVFWNIIALHDADGHLVGSASLGEDITERLRAERALRESEERYRTLFNNSTDALLVRAIGKGEEPGPLIEANETASRMLGYTHEELLTLRPEELTVQESGPRARQWLRMLLERGQCLFETTYHAKDGHGISVEVSSSLIEYRGEMAVLSTVRDISERRRLEEQLLESRKMESIGRLAGGIAHDFNNILTAIAGHATFALDDGTMSDEAREELAQLLKAADRAAALTRQLLAFSRRQIITQKVLQANDLVVDMAPMLERMIGERHHLGLQLAEDLGLVSADATQLQQVMSNLVVNARDAMPAGGDIVVRTENVAVDRGPLLSELDLKPGKYVVISVIDSGTGMTEEVRQRIFEPFFTTKSVGKGTGMGLPTALGIIKQHHGSIRVSSIIGEGTTFAVYLPRALDVVDVPDDGDLGTRLPAGTETVLVVESDEQTRALTVRALRQLGYHVLEAATGEKAEAAVRDGESPVDLLLADVLMADSDGHELARRLLHLRPDLKVLFVSAAAESNGGSLALASEPDGQLTWPFSTAALAYKVRQLLDHPADEGAS